MGLVPRRSHLWIDSVIGVALALSPWLLGFADEPINQWAPYVHAGLCVFGIAALTEAALTGIGPGHEHS